jgi:hypothetical protein
MNSTDGWNYSKQFMEENGFVRADKITVEESTMQMQYIEADGGMHLSEPLVSTKSISRISNSYAKPDELYNKTAIHYENPIRLDIPFSRQTITTYAYKVPAGATSLIPNNSNAAIQKRNQENRQSFIQNSLELVKLIIQTIF